MLSLKPVLGFALLGLGAASMGVAVYTQTPDAFTTRTAPPLAPAVTAEVETETLSVAPDPEPAVPVPAAAKQAASRRTPRAVRPPAPPATVETRLMPCSDWQDMKIGPQGRHVRQLCRVVVPVASTGPTPDS